MSRFDGVEHVHECDGAYWAGCRRCSYDEADGVAPLAEKEPRLDPRPFASIGTARHSTGKGGGSFDPRPGYSQNRADYPA